MQTSARQTHTHQQLKLRELTIALDTMELAELQAVWKKIYGVRTFVRSRTYLRRLLAYRCQEFIQRGSAPEVRRAIGALAHRAPNTAKTEAAETCRTADAPAAPYRDPRLPAPGTVLRREHGGRAHEVLVTEGDCIYGGVRYRSLSAVAVKISGVQVNGYAFFARALRESAAAHLEQGGAR